MSNTQTSSTARKQLTNGGHAWSSILPSLQPIAGDGLHMAYSPMQSPTQGGSLLGFVFSDDTQLPRDAIYYFQFEGNTHRHVTPAKRLGVNKLNAYIPCHPHPEVISVRVLLYRHGGFRVLACSSFSYVKEPAQDLALFLVRCSQDNDRSCGTLEGAARRECPGAFEDMTTLDTRLRRELERVDLPAGWNLMGYRLKENDSTPNHDTLLHFAASLNLQLVLEFLLQFPGAEAACSIANHNGLTPVQVAYSARHYDTLCVLLGYNQVELSPPKWQVLEPTQLQASPDQSIYRHEQGALCVTSHPRHSNIDADIELLQEMASLQRHRSNDFQIKTLLSPSLPQSRPHLSTPLPRCSFLNARQPVAAGNDGTMDERYDDAGLPGRYSYPRGSQKHLHIHHKNRDCHSNASGDISHDKLVPSSRADGTVAMDTENYVNSALSMRPPIPPRRSVSSHNLHLTRGGAHNERSQAIHENHRRLKEITDGIEILRQINARQIPHNGVNPIERPAGVGTAAQHPPSIYSSHQVHGRLRQYTSCPSLHHPTPAVKPVLQSRHSCAGSATHLLAPADMSDDEQPRYIDVLPSSDENASSSLRLQEQNSTDLSSIQKDAQNIIDDVTRSVTPNGSFDENSGNLPDVAWTCEIRSGHVGKTHSSGSCMDGRVPNADRKITKLLLSLPPRRSLSLSSLDEQDEPDESQMRHDTSAHLTSPRCARSFTTATLSYEQWAAMTPTCDAKQDAALLEKSDMDTQDTLDFRLGASDGTSGCEATSNHRLGNSKPPPLEVVSSHSMAPADVKVAKSVPASNFSKSAPPNITSLAAPNLTIQEGSGKDPENGHKDENKPLMESAGDTDVINPVTSVTPSAEESRLLSPDFSNNNSSDVNEPGEEGDEEDQTDTAAVSTDNNNDSKEEKKRRSSMFSKIGSYRQKKAGKESRVAVQTTHQFVGVSFSNSTSCDLCDKSMANKPALQCENCMVNVHENSCQELIPPCTKMKPPKSPQSPSPGSEIDVDKKTNSLPGVLITGGAGQTLKSSQSFKEKRATSVPGRTTLQISHSASTLVPHSPSSSKAINEESVSEKPKEEDTMCRIQLPEPSNIGEGLSVSMESLDETSTDFVDLEEDPDLVIDPSEPEAWSVTVDKKVLKKLSSKDIKRQDHIWELIQTERRHNKTLQIMNKRFVLGMRREVNLSQDMIDRIFPQLNELLDIHQNFVNMLLDRQQESDDRSIRSIGDVIVRQFDAEMGERMKMAYGEFCSRHTEAVKMYKDLLKHERKFQAFIKKCRRCDTTKRFGVQECILLVTQRMTKYPLLIDAIIKTTHGDEAAEKEDLARAVELARGILTYIDQQVDLYQKKQQLLEIYNKIDVRSHTLYKGRKFKKSDLLNRVLVHEGPVRLMSARGKLTEVKVVILSDVILFLLENNQKYAFFSPDNKGSVVSLSKLLVREKGANRDSKGLYLICRGQKEPEMYELVCHSVEDRKAWIKRLKAAIEKCPEGVDVVSSDNEEERKHQLEAHAVKLRDLISRLHDKDQEIGNLCGAKMKLVSEILEVSSGEDVMTSIPTTNDEATPEYMEQQIVNVATQLLAQLRVMRGTSVSRSGSSASDSETFQLQGSKPRRAETFSGFDRSKSDNGTYTEREENLTEDEGALKISCDVLDSSESSTDTPTSQQQQPAVLSQKVFRRGSMFVHSSTSDVDRGKERKLVRRMSTSLLPSLLAKRYLEREDDQTPGGEGDDSCSEADSLSQDQDGGSQDQGASLQIHRGSHQDQGIMMQGYLPMYGTQAHSFREQSILVGELQAYVHKLVTISSKRNTEIQSIRAHLSDANSKLAALTVDNSKLHQERSKHGGYQHDKQLEELRNLQESIQKEKVELGKQKDKQNQWLEDQMAKSSLQQETFEREKMEFKKKKDDLQREKEALQRQIDLFETQKTEFAEQKAQFAAQRERFHLNLTNKEGGLGGPSFLNATVTHQRTRERSASPMAKYPSPSVYGSQFENVSHKRSASDDLQTSPSYQQGNGHDRKVSSTYSCNSVPVPRDATRKPPTQVHTSDSLRRDASLPAHLMSAVNENKVSGTTLQQIPHKLAGNSSNLATNSGNSSPANRGTSPKHSQSSASFIPVSSHSSPVTSPVFSPPPVTQYPASKPQRQPSPPKPSHTTVSRQPSKAAEGTNILPLKLAEAARLPMKLAENPSISKQRPKSAGSASQPQLGKMSAARHSSSGSKGHVQSSATHSYSDKPDESKNKNKREETKIFYF